MKSQSKKTKHKPASVRYNIHHFDDYKKLTDQSKTKAFVYMNLVKAVKSGVEDNVNTIELFKLADSNISLILPKDSWKTSLSKAIEFFTEKEMFETCTECQKLIELIEV